MNGYDFMAGSPILTGFIFFAAVVLTEFAKSISEIARAWGKTKSKPKKKETVDGDRPST